jgi:hypothetical protein
MPPLPILGSRGDVSDGGSFLDRHPAASLFESNFPVDKGSYSYPVFWNACKLLAKGASEAEKAQLFADTAPGMDGLTWQAYAADPERNLTDRTNSAAISGELDTSRTSSIQRD